MLVQARHCVRLALDFGELTITAEVEARLEELGFTPETLIDAIGEHKSDCSGNPSIYCGTYGKFSGEKYICGLWIDLTTFNDYDDFLNFCNAIHADEEDPELMAQDYEGFPRQWYNEGFMSEDDFDHILEYSDMCDLSRSALLYKEPRSGGRGRLHGVSRRTRQLRGHREALDLSRTLLRQLEQRRRLRPPHRRGMLRP